MIDISIIADPLENIQGDTLIILTFEGDHDYSSSVNRVNQALTGHLDELITSGDYVGKLGQTITLYPREHMNVGRIIATGLGKSEELSLEKLRRAFANGILRAQELRAVHVTTVLDWIESVDFDVTLSVACIAESGLMASYRYIGKKTKEDDRTTITKIDIIVEPTDLNEAEAGRQKGEAFGKGACLAREMVNQPPNVCTPDYLAGKAENIASELGMNCEVLSKQQLTALKMGAFLGVAQGSDTPPRFIIMEHNREQAAELDTIVLVGKGVTFDTGGYSLKTKDGMISMKSDMGGAAAVISAMSIIGRLQVPLHVVGLIPAVDNMISGHAYRPSDVLTASNGKTIEVISTDAEGRLMLADALVYAKRFSPTVVVDIATLTGACVTALGKQAAGLFGTKAGLIDRLIRAGDMTGERVWPLPLYPEYREAIESESADMRNSGGAGSGVGTSAIFLKEFIEYSVWAHLDIAGMVSDLKGNPYIPNTGASGFGARLLAEFVCNWVKTEKIN